MHSVTNCPLCDGQAELTTDNSGRDITNVNCRRCGHFEITDMAETRLTLENKPLLSAYARRTSDAGSPVKILFTNIDDLVASLPKYNPAEKLDNLLQLLAERTSGLGSCPQFDPDNDYPLLVSPDRREIDYLLCVLFRRGLIEGTFVERAFDTEATVMNVKLTMDGWEKMEALKRVGRSSSRAFVAMWFDPSMDDIYRKAIEPAIKTAGYDPLRIDKSEHVNRIDDEIIGQIRRARFMVADFTGQRHGVYFEAGMMLGLGRNVIWMSHRREI